MCCYQGSSTTIRHVTLFTEQQHFDNPVYSFQGSTRGDDSTTLLNNANHIHNNFGVGSKLNNTTMEMLRNRATGSSDRELTIITDGASVLSVFYVNTNKKYIIKLN